MRSCRSRSPVVAVAGTIALSRVEDTCVTLDAAVSSNFTVEFGVNPIPRIVTTVPNGPLAGLRLVIDSVGVKVAVLVALPAAEVTEILRATTAIAHPSLQRDSPSSAGGWYAKGANTIYGL